MAQKKNNPIPTESTKHKDKWVNIPTEELRRFVEVVALKETMRIMREIDEVIPSWPIA
jgi:hypothetical protein